MNAPSRSQAYLWDGLLIYATPSLRNGKHRHHPASLHIAVDGPFRLDVDGVGPRDYRLALIAPNARAAVDTGRHPLVDILIDPESAAFACLRPLLGDAPVIALPRERLAGFELDLRAMLAGTLDCGTAFARVEAILAALCDYRPRPPALDPRIRTVLSHLEDRLAEPPPVAELAAAAGVSESRFMALFKAQLGLPVRQYLLWRRLRQAAALWDEGRSLSDLAVAAGFYDQAHFTRTVKRMLAIAPSLLADPGRTVVHNCMA